MNDEREFNDPEFEDPDEQQRFENEMLKLKLQAEHGAVIGGDLSELPPEIEAEFLKNIFAFQQTIGNNTPVSMLEALGNPTLPPAGGMTPSALEAAWETLDELLDERGFSVNFLAEYPTEVKYRFVAEELVQKPVMWPMPEGMTMHTIYEEYHPNHKWDIENRTRGLFQAIFENDPEAMRQALADDMVGEKDNRISTDQCVALLEPFLERLGEILEWDIEILETQFDLEEKEVPFVPAGEPQEDDPEHYTETHGLANCKGRVKLFIRKPDGEERSVSGPFKTHLSLEGGWWSIFHFLLPGWR